MTESPSAPLVCGRPSNEQATSHNHMLSGSEAHSANGQSPTCQLCLCQSTCPGQEIADAFVKALAAANGSARLFFKTPQNVDFLSTAFVIAPMPLGPERQNTRGARMTRRPRVAECLDETACLHPNVLTGHKVSPDTTRQKARHSKWSCSEHFNQRQSTRNVRRTDATKCHCCRTTKGAPIGTPLTPWRAQKRQQ